MNDKNRFGRFLALVLIAGAVYGVRSIARGGLGCPLADHSCCGGMEHEAAGHDDHDKPDMAKPDDADDSDDEAAVSAKAPVVPGKAQ